MSKTIRGRKTENEEDPNDRGSLIVLTSMKKGRLLNICCNWCQRTKMNKMNIWCHGVKDELVEYMCQRSKMDKMDQRWAISQKMTKIKRLKDHHDIGRICAHIHAHKTIVEYNTYAQMLSNLSE